MAIPVCGCGGPAAPSLVAPALGSPGGLVRAAFALDLALSISCPKTGVRSIESAIRVANAAFTGISAARPAYAPQASCPVGWGLS